MLKPNPSAMKTLNPSLSEFHLHALDTAILTEEQAHITFRVELEHEHITQRVMLSLLDETRTQGAAISIYPATGEVCDLTNDGGVIGYLSDSPFSPRQPIACEISIFRFGKNWVCQANIAGETFLYPAFRMEGDVKLTAIVGGGVNGTGIQWDEEKLTVSSSTVVAA
jgi:hypothetical protein